MSESETGSKGKTQWSATRRLWPWKTWCLSLEYVGWAYSFTENRKGHRKPKDQLTRASQAIPLNIAEGNGKATDGDRRRYFEIVRGSALECAAAQDVLEVCGVLSKIELGQA